MRWPRMEVHGGATSLATARQGRFSAFTLSAHPVIAYDRRPGARGSVAAGRAEEGRRGVRTIVANGVGVTAGPSFNNRG